MSSTKLNPHAIDAYNRLGKECAAFNYVLRHSKQTGPVTDHTLLALNGMVNLANRLFRRHAELPFFNSVDTSAPMSQADLAIFVARLTAACIRFEEIHRVDPARGVLRHHDAIGKSSYQR